MRQMDLPRAPRQVPPRVDVIWEDPPDASKMGRPPKPIWAALQANPGRWALIRIGLRQPSHGYTQDVYPGFQFTVRKGEDGWSLYARYIGLTNPEER